MASCGAKNFKVNHNIVRNLNTVADLNTKVNFGLDVIEEAALGAVLKEKIEWRLWDPEHNK